MTYVVSEECVSTVHTYCTCCTYRVYLVVLPVAVSRGAVGGGFRLGEMDFLPQLAAARPRRQIQPVTGQQWHRETGEVAEAGKPGERVAQPCCRRSAGGWSQLDEVIVQRTGDIVGLLAAETVPDKAGSEAQSCRKAAHRLMEQRGGTGFGRGGGVITAAGGPNILQ